MSFDDRKPRGWAFAILVISLLLNWVIHGRAASRAERWVSRVSVLLLKLWLVMNVVALIVLSVTRFKSGWPDLLLMLSVFGALLLAFYLLANGEIALPEWSEWRWLSR